MDRDNNTSETNIIFLGGMFPPDSDDWIRQNSIGNIHNAANVMQWNFIHGFAHHTGPKLHIISSPFVGSFPKFFKKMVVPDVHFNAKAGAHGRSIGFLNLPVVKHYSRYFRLRKPLRDAVQSSRPPRAMIAYSFTSVMAFSLKRAKLADPSIVTCLVVADLPGFMNLSAKRSKLSRFLGKMTRKRLYKTLQHVDCAVLLTEPMASKMEFAKPYVVIEGISAHKDSTGTDLDLNDTTNRTENMVVYTGGLNEAFGVLNLVEAFSTLPDRSLRLVLCGTGDAVPAIEEYAKADSRIIYKGLLPHDEVVALQRQATVLVNPRQNTGEYVKYSFPSKLMEYMVSGTPTISYDLDGMPAEYRDYLFLVPDHEIRSLASTIQRVLTQSPAERRWVGQRARDFVLTQKNPAVQTEKVLRMIAAILKQREERYGLV